MAEAAQNDIGTAGMRPAFSTRRAAKAAEQLSSPDGHRDAVAERPLLLMIKSRL